MSNDKLSSKYRRSFLKKLGIGFAGVQTASLFSLPMIAYSDEEMPLVAEDDPVAVSLTYVHDATSSEARTDEAAICSNCMLFTGAEGSETGPCSIFPGKQVSAKGWCSAWNKRS